MKPTPIPQPFYVREAEISYFLKLLPLSSLNTPDISWFIYDTFPRTVVVRRRVSDYIDDEFSIIPALGDAGLSEWEITGQRVAHGRNTGEFYRTEMPIPLRANSRLITTLDTLLTKAVIACAPRPQVAAIGTMSFAPVEGEPDYVKPTPVSTTLATDECGCTQCRADQPCGEFCDRCTCGYVEV